MSSQTSVDELEPGQIVGSPDAGPSRRAKRQRRKERTTAQYVAAMQLDNEIMATEDAQADLDAAAEEDRIASESFRNACEEQTREAEYERVGKEIREEMRQGQYSVAEKLLHMFTGMNNIKLHVIRDEDRQDYIQALKALETKRRQPLSSKDPEFPITQTLPIFQPGFHICVHEKTMNILLECRITPWGEMNMKERESKLRAIHTIMAYTQSANGIKTNGTPHQSQRFQDHAKKSDHNVNRPKPHGNMFAGGWHRTKGERGVHLSRYTVDKSGGSETRQKKIDIYSETSEDFSHVAEEYSEGLRRMYPLGYNLLKQHAEMYDVPSFDQLEMVTLHGKPIVNAFANSITITNDDFANYQHMDRDAIAIAYGWWWIGWQDPRTKTWHVKDEYDHDKVQGGEFLVAEHGVMIDFSRARGLVEIFWRGNSDHHGTMSSMSSEGVTRFGTSIQVTADAVAGMAAWKDDGYNPAKIVGNASRLEFARQSMERAKSKKRS
ncbi:hypothetical protein VNI00_005510 [Paramarasmius palmivorus]|uniref:Tet-like 2OG-Fe(II) oxygenase domain-containing protein n=1 Tax=Paramarasmius palmivorus TaxID=297713 RepID=A0AAW0DG30_9AGAR